MTTTKIKRSYQSESRREQAEATRRKILEAAYDLFKRDGYAITTLAAIAKAAQVSPQTLISHFGTKFMLLDALIKSYTRGDDAPSPLVTRAWWKEMLQEPDPVEQVRRYARTVRDIHERTTDIFEIIRGAAAGDVEIAAFQRGLNKGRLEDLRTVADSLAAKDALLPGLSVDKAQDILWALGSSGMYRSIVVDRNWSPQEYEAWLAQTLIATLIKVKR